MPLSSLRWLVVPVVLLATHFTACAAETPKPFLWRIEGGSKPSYIFGTIHLSGKDVTTLSPATQKAVDSADALYTEISMDMATQMKATTLLMGDESLAKVLPKDLYERAEAELKRINPELNLQPFDRIKIWGLAVTIALIEEQLKNPGALPLDAVLYTTAQRAGKQVGGIETMEEQLGLFEHLSKDEQIAMLRGTLDDIERARKEGRNPLDEMRKAYVSGDLPTLDKTLNEWMTGFDPKLLARFMDALITKRNHLMANRIGEKLKAAPGKSQFFAIGAAHLMGEEGVLKLLEKQGLKVTRVMEE